LALLGSSTFSIAGAGVIPLPLLSTGGGRVETGGAAGAGGVLGTGGVTGFGLPLPPPPPPQPETTANVAIKITGKDPRPDNALPMTPPPYVLQLQPDQRSAYRPTAFTYSVAYPQLQSIFISARQFIMRLSGATSIHFYLFKETVSL
jgi:hypothetical protein